MANFAQNLVFNGLGTLSTVLTPGNYFIEGKISLPTITGGSGVSAVLTTITQNGGTVYTGIAGAEGFRTLVSCTGTDTIAIILSSSADADKPLNVIKAVISIGEGT